MCSIAQQDFYSKINGIDCAEVVAFNPAVERISHLDCTSSNKELSEIDLTNTHQFSEYIFSKLKLEKSKYLIGGYDENRTLYKRSRLFDGTNELPRTIHLGTDIWGESGTLIYAPLDAVVHSFAFNDHFGDYGATLILRHSIQNFSFHTLYGHISLDDISKLSIGQPILKGEAIGKFGDINENGHWPPHLHFQLIVDMGEKKGDYPGVCSIAERTQFLANCPDPDCILKLNLLIST